jgi:beta-lactamase regulating signal transducer with metallopeptidase domain
VEWSYWTINISLISSLVAILILFYRKVAKYNPFINMFLWSVLAIRFVIPASYVTSFSIVSFYRLLGINITSTQGLNPFYFSNVISQAISYHPLTFKSALILVIFQIIAVLWISGIMLLLGSFFISTLHHRKLIKRSKHLGIIRGLNVYESNKVASPFLFGIFKPVVFIPLNFKRDHFELVIQHELAHQKNQDNLKKLLGLIVCSIHWFNPLVWFCFKRFSEDMEIEADRKAIGWIGKENQKKYLETLVLLNQEKGTLIESGFSDHPLIRRIKIQLEYRPNIMYTLWGFSIIILVAYFVLLANL